MELISTPYRPSPRRRRPILVGLALAVLLAVTAVVLVPLALGMHHVVVRDAAMGSSWRGALAIEEAKPGPDLGAGTVITFVPPGSPPGTHQVTRRVVSVTAGVAMTRADRSATNDPWALQLDETTYARVVVHAPWVGSALTGYRPAVLAALLAVLTTMALTWRRQPRVLPAPAPERVTHDV